MSSTHGAAAVAALPAPALAGRDHDPPLLQRVRALAEELVEPGPGWSQEERVALISELETLKNVCAGAQATATLDLHEQAARDREQTEGTFGHARREREGVTAEVALARKVSPARSRNLIDLAVTLPTRLPHTLEALRHGRASEWAASLVAKATAALTDEQALAVDAALAAALGRCSEAQLEKKANALAYEADKRAYLERARRAVRDRHVSMRPVADGMVRLSALLPVAEGIAAYTSLDAAAAGLRASGASEPKGALRADELVRRLTGIDPTTHGLPVEIGIVMTDRALFNDGAQSARVPGYGPVPAAVARMLAAFGTTRPDTARHLAGEGATDRATAWVRRLFTDPLDGSLAQIDTRRRLFSGALRRFVLARDQECVMPYCGATIRSVDHVDRARDGGATSGDNGQGMCEACNLDKEAEDLTTGVVRGADGRRAVRFRTRYGQTHTTGPPPVLDTLTDLTSGWHGERPPWWSSTAERAPRTPRG
ncbi:HNH endonuclease [Ornithinimicrobium sufpigmenti]|uniref:HNH endonuclease n=1 Tax=Ornithinimicrobium sufpigmenti TaxID=2508882 RepID=UPI0010364A07|nr:MULTISPECIES: HNH endonuclease signature motif containing protein [unclassified Ornithinimicrobium]